MGRNGQNSQELVLKVLLGVLTKTASRGAAGTFQIKTGGPNKDAEYLAVLPVAKPVQ